jgi:transposase
LPGLKSDIREPEWCAQLLPCGLLRGSFIPPRWQRALCDLTRHRTQVVEARVASASTRCWKTRTNIMLGL